jgi:hypothetical protein
MGYTTKFTGSIALSRPLTLAEAGMWLGWADNQESVPRPCPDSYLQWIPIASLDALIWDGGEKFYNYIEWLQWICTWLRGLGIDSNGRIAWDGEEQGDVGMLVVGHGVVTARKLDLNAAVNRQCIVVGLPEIKWSEPLSPGVVIDDSQRAALDLADLREQVAQLTAMNEKLNAQAVRDAARITDLRSVPDTTVYERNILLADMHRLRKIETAAKMVASASPAAFWNKSAAAGWTEPRHCIQCQSDINELRDALGFQRLPAPANTPVAP